MVGEAQLDELAAKDAEIAKLKEELRASEERIRLVMAKIPVAFIVARPDRTIEAANSTVESMFGYRRDELARQPLSLVVPEFKEETPGASQLFGIRKDQKSFPCQVQWLDVETPGGAKRFLFITDVSERYELEQLKSDFVSMVGHDLNTPLTSVKICLEMIATGIYGEMQPTGLHLIETVQQSVERLISLISDLLDIDRLETGRLDLLQEDWLLSTIADKSMQSVMGLGDAKNVQVVSEIQDGKVVVDRDRMVQVLVNLLSNAIKFAPANSRVVLKGWRENGEIGLTVQDSGPGIPDELKAVVFDRYRQLSQKHQTRIKGFGLGLAICQAIVENHGGKIWVEDAPGSGCSFQIRLPATGIL